jgi:hypothetical protein
VRYVEPLSDARTKLEAFFNILLGMGTGDNAGRLIRTALHGDVLFELMLK